jgi:N-acetylmuramoyl-L-alanine amidase
MKLKLHVIITLVLLQCSVIQAQLPIVGADSLQKHYTKKAKQWLDKDASCARMYTIDLFGFTMYASPEDKAAQRAEYRITWQELSTFQHLMASTSAAEAMQIMQQKGGGPFSPEIQKRFYISSPVSSEYSPQAKLPLNGLRIALDPGHIAGDTTMGQIEQKFLKIKVWNGRDSVDQFLVEGILTWQTAALLKYQLEQAGAQVLLTRNGPGLTAFGYSFEEWKNLHYQRSLDSLVVLDPANANLKKLKSGKERSDKFIFWHVFREIEMRKRAELINAFHADLTVIIHYNVNEKNTDWKVVTAANYNMCFIPGAFTAAELSTPESRFHFIRLLFSEQIEASGKASNGVLKSVVDKTAVPAAQQSDATYLEKSCVKYAPGVYCRNLGLTRLVTAPLIYGETLYMDHSTEFHALQYASVEEPSERVKTIAAAYYAGVVEWALHSHPN